MEFQVTTVKLINSILVSNDAQNFLDYASVDSSKIYLLWMRSLPLCHYLLQSKHKSRRRQSKHIFKFLLQVVHFDLCSSMIMATLHFVSISKLLSKFWTIQWLLNWTTSRIQIKQSNWQNQRGLSCGTPEFWILPLRVQKFYLSYTPWN